MRWFLKIIRKAATFVSGMVVGIGVTLGSGNTTLSHAPQMPAKNVAHVDNANGGNQLGDYPSDILEDVPVDRDSFPSVLEDVPVLKRGEQSKTLTAEPRITPRRRKTDYHKLAKNTNYEHIPLQGKGNYNGKQNFTAIFKQQLEKYDLLDHTFIVQKDSTLGQYAEAQGTTYEQLAEMNGLEDPNLIYESEVLLTASCCPGVSEEDIPHNASQRWWKMNSRPTKEDVQRIFPNFDVPDDVKAGWKSAMESGQGFQADIPRGMKLEQLTFGLADGGTGQKEGVYALWTQKNEETGEWVETPSEAATVWLTNVSGADYALLLFEKCKNAAWFKVPGEQPTPTIPAAAKVCPECENKIIEIERRVPYPVEKPAPKETVKERPVQPITSITASSGTGNISNLTVAGNNVFGGVRFQTRRYFGLLKGVLDAGIAWDSATGFTLAEESTGTFHITFIPTIHFWDFAVSNQTNVRPQKPDVDSNSTNVTWTHNFGRIYTQTGYSFAKFFANERRPDSYYTGIWGKLGLNILGNTGRAGLFFDAASKFENAEWGANYFMWKKALPGAFVEFIGRNMGVVGTYSFVEEHSFDKVDMIEGHDTVHRLGFHFYWLPDWQW